MSQAAPHKFDATDPHGAQAGHDHVVVSWQMLVFILCSLLFLTALTVFTAQAEAWVASVWGIEHLPGWINLLGAMSIATLKALLVASFFMQLKYDKAINSIVMVTCLICVWLFLMFVIIDLGNRGKVETFKTQYYSEGGNGYSLNNAIGEGTPAIMSARLSPHVNTSTKSLALFRAEQAITNFPDESQRGKKIAEKYFDDPYYTENTELAFWHHYYDYTYLSKGKAPHHHERDTENYFDSFLVQNHAKLTELGLEVHHGNGHAESDANISRPRHGLTAGLFDAPGAADAHGTDSHDSDAEHTPPETHSQESSTESNTHEQAPQAPIDPPVRDDH